MVTLRGPYWVLAVMDRCFWPDALLGLSLPGVTRLVTWTILAVNNRCSYRKVTFCKKCLPYVSMVSADGAGTMKRFHPRAQGRPFPIRKRTCNITLKMKERSD
jgi:hypothetical protein